MIFVTVGSAPYDFTRLVKKMDEIAEEIAEEIIIQKGFTKYIPKNAKWFDFVTYEKALNYFRSANIIVSHSSAGPILFAKKFNKPLVIFPRDGLLNEHIDSHQIETAKAIEKSYKKIEVVYNEDDLLEAIKRALKKVDEGIFYEENKEVKSLIEYIISFIKNI